MDADERLYCEALDDDVSSRHCDRRVVHVGNRSRDALGFPLSPALCLLHLKEAEELAADGWEAIAYYMMKSASARRTLLDDLHEAEDAWTRSERVHWTERAKLQRQVKEAARRQGYVYFLRVGPCIKIGFSTNVERRVRSLKGAYKDHVAVLELLGMYSGTQADEAALHRRFAHLRDLPSARELRYLDGGSELFYAEDNPTGWPLLRFVESLRSDNTAWYVSRDTMRDKSDPRSTPHRG